MDNELKKYLAIVRQWAWLIALVTLLAAGTAYLASRTTPPTYSASTKILVNQAPSAAQAGYGSILITNDQLARTYADMLVQQPVVAEVVATLQLNVKTDDLVRTIKVNLVGTTQLLQIQVENADPALAAAIANAVPVAFSRQNAALQASRYADSKASLTKDMDALNTQIVQAQAKIDAIGTPGNAQAEADLSRQQTELTQMRQSYASLRQSYENIRLAEAQSTSNIVVTEPARVPDEPIRPRPFQNTVLGGIVGLLLAVGIVFLMEYLDDRIRAPEQLVQALGFPVIGLIARMNGNARRGSNARVNANHQTGANSSALIAMSEPRSPIVEAFRGLRTNIQFASVDQPIRTLLVTSAGPSEGKSTVAANLAIVMAQAGRHVVLVDADLRRPMVHKLFEQKSRLGLTDLMLQPQESVAWDKVALATATPDLSIITCGSLPPNPSELLGSKRMQQFIAHLHEMYDVVILDTPPLLAVTDALILSSTADGVLLVVSAGFTRMGAAVLSKQQLEQASARVLGVVMNNVPTKRGSRYYSYYYQSQDEYYYDAPSDDASGASSPSRSKRGRRRRSAVEASAVDESLP